MFGQYLSIHRIFKRPAKALIRLRVCAGWSEPSLVAHSTLLEISCRGSFIFTMLWLALFSRYSESNVLYNVVIQWRIRQQLNKCKM